MNIQYILYIASYSDIGGHNIRNVLETIWDLEKKEDFFSHPCVSLENFLYDQI